MLNVKGYYLDLFKVDEGQLSKLVREGIRGGGSYCDLFFEYSVFGKGEDSFSSL